MPWNARRHIQYFLLKSPILQKIKYMGNFHAHKNKQQTLRSSALAWLCFLLSESFTLSPCTWSFLSVVERVSGHSWLCPWEAWISRWVAWHSIAPGSWWPCYSYRWRRKVSSSALRWIVAIQSRAWMLECLWTSGILWLVCLLHFIATLFFLVVWKVFREQQN